MVVAVGGPSEIDIDVCILGAGPHGLAAAVHLRHADPSLKVSVLDPSGKWMARWSAQFSQAEISTLRSPVVHHPSPDPYALTEFIANNGLARSGLKYDPPTTAAFAQFCQSLIQEVGLADPIAVAPRSLCSKDKHLTIEAKGVPTFRARHLIVATNPHRRPIPDWVWPLTGRQPDMVMNGSDVDLPALPSLTGERIAIIGGGLTAAHLACGAASRGAHVQLISRRNLDIRTFDTAPGWLGPKYLAAFDAEPSPQRRLASARLARGGGSIPEWMHTRLTDFDGNGQIELCESTQVHAAQPQLAGGCELHLTRGDSLHADRVWLATGTQADPHALRCLRPLLADVADVKGFPLLTDELRMGPHPAFMMGRATMLSLGPAAGNLWGAQRAAHRITQAITGVDLAARTTHSIPAINSTPRRKSPWISPTT